MGGKTPRCPATEGRDSRWAAVISAGFLAESQDIGSCFSEEMQRFLILYGVGSLTPLLKPVRIQISARYQKPEENQIPL